MKPTDTINLAAIIIANSTGIMLLATLLLNNLHSGIRRIGIDDKFFYAMVVVDMIQCIIEPITFSYRR